MLNLVTSYNAAGKIMSYGGGEVRILRGYYSGVADAYIRVYDTDVTLTGAGSAANDADLVVCLPVQSQSAFYFEFGPGEVTTKRAVQVVFSTAAKSAGFTLGSSGDIFASIEDTSGCIGVTKATADDFQVGPAAGRLIKVSANNSTGLVDGFLAVYTESPVEGTTVPIWTGELKSSGITEYYFGRDGLNNKSYAALYLAASLSGRVATAPGDPMTHNIYTR